MIQIKRNGNGDTRTASKDITYNDVFEASSEHATQMEWFEIACDYTVKNAELRERLEKAKNALQMACAEMAILGICCQGCENEENCMIKFLDGGYKMKAKECEKYWLSKAEARLAEMKGGRK